MAGPSRAVTTPSNTTMFTAVTPGGNYHRTFFDIRSRHSLSDQVAAGEANDVDDGLKSIIKLTWNIWAVSPLFDLRYEDEVMLKKYAKRLREKVSATLSDENVAYEARFTILEDLVCNPRDPPALQVQVNSTKHGEDDVTCIYKGIFLSWGERRDAEPGNVKLPILLTRGAQKVTDAVHSVLRKTFDCVITAMPASQEDLMWLTTIILNFLNKDEQKSMSTRFQELTLRYEIPGLPTTDSISCKFFVHSVRSLWTKICPPQHDTSDTGDDLASMISLEQVKKFYECIRIQMLDNASIELGCCLLNEISLPSLTIKGNRMKVATPNAMDRVLWFFHEKALLYTPAMIPVINFTTEHQEEDKEEDE